VTGGGYLAHHNPVSCITSDRGVTIRLFQRYDRVEPANDQNLWDAERCHLDGRCALQPMRHLRRVAAEQACNCRTASRRRGIRREIGNAGERYRTYEG
jgi:hypothetical protein